MSNPVAFFSQDPLAATYPRPRLPVLPVLSTRSFHETTEAEFPSRFFGADCVALRSGRAAIAQALRLAGVGPGQEVLIPGYHCGSMVEPALWAGADVAFFDIHADLTLDYGDLERKLSARTRVIIAPHYFGFPQALDPLLLMRERHGFLVIEDCSHALFGSSAGQVLGSRGDFAITSTSKWFAAMEGGALCCNGGPRLSGRLPSLSRSARYEVRAALATLTEATDYGRLPLLRPFVGLANVLSRWTKPVRSEDDARAHAPAGAALRWLDPAQIDSRPSWLTTQLIRRSARHASAQRRRAHFEFLSGRLSALKRARPLFPALPAGVVPYMFPLLLENPATDFRRIKRSGVPVWRWEDLAVSDCPVSLDYRERLLQIPCHQELEPAELDWLADQLCELLG